MSETTPVFASEGSWFTLLEHKYDTSFYMLNCGLIKSPNLQIGPGKMGKHFLML